MGERVLAAAGLVVLLALLALALVPVHHEDADGPSGAVLTTNTTAARGGGANPPQASSPGAPGGPTSSSGAATVRTVSAATGGAPSATDPCSGRAGDRPGITETTVKVDFTAVSLAGPVGNSMFHIRTDIKEIAQAVADDINAAGGVACGRKLVVKTYDVNPIDPNDGQSKCLQVVADKPLAVLDFAGYVTPASQQCFVDAKVPYAAYTSLGETKTSSSFPYLFGPSASSEKQVRDSALGLAARGWFKDPAFKKLGLMLDGCDPHVNSELEKDLAKAGLTSGQISKFVLDCNLVAPPNQISQAVLQHKIDGATHVLLATALANSQNYTKIAVQQGFRPRWAASDYGSNLYQATADGWDASFDGAIGITSTRVGDLLTGVRSPAAANCDRIVRAHGLHGVDDERTDSGAYPVCDLFALLRQALNHAGANPTRESTIQALGTIGHYDSAGVGDGEFDRAGKVSGGDYHRTIEWRSNCACWKPISAFERGF